MDTVKDRLNGYTYITFYLVYHNIKCDTYYDIIVDISMLPPIHCHSTSIAIYYTSAVLYVDSDGMIDVEIFKIYLMLLLQESDTFHYYFFTNSKYQNLLPHSIEE